jgi:HK97 family phage prohead protease
MTPTPILNTIERRFMPGSVELRAAEDGSPSRTIRGYAAKFETPSEDLGGFIETIAAGAFDDVMGNDVRALFNHDPSHILARARGGEGDTLRIGTDAVGLWYEFDSPQTRAGDDLLESIRRGDVDQSSFGFIIAKDGDKWAEGKTSDGKNIITRTITKLARLLDVSPVTYPAYPDTSVALRSMAEALPDFPPAPPADPPSPEPPLQRWHPSLGLYQIEAEPTENT